MEIFFSASAGPSFCLEIGHQESIDLLSASL